MKEISSLLNECIIYNDEVKYVDSSLIETDNRKTSLLVTLADLVFLPLNTKGDIRQNDVVP